MKIYLAAMYGQMFEMCEVRDQLVAAGHEITAQWIDGKEKGDAAATEKTLIKAAIMDVEDVMRADVLVAFSQARGTMHTGGGRHVEFGVAICAGIPVIVVGPKGEHVFHYMPGVQHVPGVEELISLLMKEIT